MYIELGIKALELMVTENDEPNMLNTLFFCIKDNIETKQ